MTTRILTIGYEGKGVDDVIERLKAHGVTTLIDARDLPLSRKKGLSKKGLAARCEGEGIGYVHARELGNPKHIRKSGASHAEMMAMYRDHLAALDPHTTLARTAEIVQTPGELACLLCYEADPATCHRTAVAEAVAAYIGGASVEDISA